MQLQRVNRTDAEKVFIVVHNVDATSITTGQGSHFLGAWDNAASVNGVDVIRTRAAIDFVLFAGVAAQDIAVDGYGRSQLWGFCDSVMMSHKAGNTTIGAGLVAETILGHAGTTKIGAFWTETAQDALSVMGIGQAGRFVMALETVVLSLSLHSAGSHVWGPGFIRGL